MTDNPTTEARSPRIESWLRSHGFFAWGTDAWIHEDDESLVMDTLSAIEAAIEAQAAALPAPEPLDVLTEARRDHQPTLYADVEHGETVRCRCGRRDHMAGWFAHFTVEVLEARLRR